MNNDLIASRLREAFKSSNLTYVELEKSTGIPKSAIQRYIVGETGKIPIDRLDLLCKAFGVNTRWVLGWEDEDEHKATIREAVNLLDQLSDDQLHIVLSLLKQLSEAR